MRSSIPLKRRGSMRAAFLYGVRDIQIKETAVPTYKPDEVLVRVRACGICPSDLKCYLGYKELFRYGEASCGLSGHEWAGEVVGVGSKVKKVSEGERVVPDIIIPCGQCKFCRRGITNLCVSKRYVVAGFAEYATAPASNLFRIPDNVSFEEACMAEPVADCLNTNVMSGIERGQDVVVIGDGPLGLVHMQLAKASGARVTISGHHSDRLELARELGADKTVNSSQEDPVQVVKALTGGYGADVVIVAAGQRAPVEQAMEMVGASGVVNLFASTYPPAKVEIDPNVIHYRQIKLTGSFDSVPYQYETALRLIGRGLVKTKPLISHTLPLEQLKDGFELMQKRKGLKIVIHP